MLDIIIDPISQDCVCGRVWGVVWVVWGIHSDSPPRTMCVWCGRVGGGGGIHTDPPPRTMCVWCGRVCGVVWVGWGYTQ